MLTIKIKQNKKFFSLRENHISQRKNAIMNLRTLFLAQFYLLAWTPFYKVSLENGGERTPSPGNQSAPIWKVTS